MNISQSPWKTKLHQVIFEAETRSGKVFDVVLLIAILISVHVVIFDSVDWLHADYGTVFYVAEWGFTILFTVEYVLRLACVRQPWRYATSFFGIVDLLAVIPTYLVFFLGGTHSLLVIRGLRLLRLFRILKIARFSTEAEILLQAVRASRPKITVFVGTVMMVVIIMGTVMHLIEGPEHGFPDIPAGIYWAVVTLTTVGYGDLVPHTMLGRMVSSLIMVLGYGLIAVPTGIVSVELAHATQLSVSTRSCPSCAREGHDLDAVFCRFCGKKL